MGRKIKRIAQVDGWMGGSVDEKCENDESNSMDYIGKMDWIGKVDKIDPRDVERTDKRNMER